MQAVHEMLLQSWGGTVRVFPAVGAPWKDVEFEDLRAEGGYRVWGARKAGATTSVSIRATSDGRLRLRDPFAGSEAIWNRSGVTKVGPNYEVDLKAGDQLDGKPAPAVK
jgi:alpha-L-fucosidase 2